MIVPGGGQKSGFVHVELQPQNVAVCVCTCRRPLMLSRCLDSLAAQLVQPDIAPTIVVVENNEEPSCRDQVREFKKLCPVPVVYVHEPVRGIARARNAALDTAMQLGVDWIAFIDDDETAEPDWLANLMALEYRSTPVIVGRRVFEYPENVPFWVVKPNSKPYQEGKQRKTAATNNVRFSVELVRSGLRFNEGLGFAGGEDTEFFAQAHDRGFCIRRTNRAVTTETAHIKRLGYFGQMYREYWSGAVSHAKACMLHGVIKGVMTRDIPAVLNGIVGAVEVLASPLCAIGGIEAFKRRALSGGRKIGRAAGRVAGLIGFVPKPYRQIVGS